MKFTLLLALLMSSSFAATNGLLLLQGIVQEELSLTVNAQSVASNLDLETTQTNLLVASVDENSNSNTGYKITISSANNGVLKRSGGSETISYLLKYDGSTVNLAGSSTTPVQSKNVGTAGVYSDSSDVNISYTGAANSSRVAGTYTDTLTFEIAAN